MMSSCQCQDKRLETCTEPKRRCGGYKTEYNKAYHKANRDNILKRKQKYHYANLQERITNGRVWASNRRARKLQATFGNEELNDLVFKEAHHLAKVRESVLNMSFEVDHIIPLKGKNVCGFHCWNNIQVVPQSYNRSKGNKLLENV